MFASTILLPAAYVPLTGDPVYTTLFVTEIQQQQLPPGDYIVRGVIGLEGHPPTRVVRTLRKR